jgi:hypothetical protein
MPIGRFTIWVGASLLALNFRILGLILSNGGLGPRKTALQFSGLVHIHPQFFTSNGDVDNAALDQALACLWQIGAFPNLCRNTISWPLVESP